MTRPFCAICTAYLSDGEIASRGVVHEPIGRELVSEGETGWLCDPTEPASIELALERCIGALSDPDVQARMRARCFESGRRFASEPVAAAYEEVYQAAIDEHRRRRSSQGTAHLPVLGGAFART